MTKELLIKFLNDHCTDDELKEVIQWVKKDSLSTLGRNLALQEWENSRGIEGLPDKREFESLLKKIHQKIIISYFKKNNNRPISRLAAWLTKAAAILLLPVLGLVIYNIYSSPERITDNAGLTVDTLQIVTPVGSRTVIQLSDGSEVFLNHGSKLKYPQKFTGKTREVDLSGEGFFKVAHNPEKPFQVKTGKVKINALGTQFNVMAYPDDKVIATTLVKGKVIVEQTTREGSFVSIGKMVPGQHLVYNVENGFTKTSKGKIEKYISWKDGKTIFDNESITQVAERLSRMFNVEIKVANDIKDYTYTVTFVDEPLFQILDLMKIATPVKYRTLSRKKLQDGTFSKQVIFLEKRE